MYFRCFKEKGWAKQTIERMQQNQLQQRALGALWIHNSIKMLREISPYLKENHVRVIVYQRQNTLALATAEANTKRDDNAVAKNRTRAWTAPQLKHLVRSMDLSEMFSAAFDHLESERIPAMFITYEDVIKNTATLQIAMHFMGLTEVELTPPHTLKGGNGHPPWELEVSTTTKWHTGVPEDYIINTEEVRAMLASGKVPGIDPCMLQNSCAIPPIKYTSSVEGRET